MSFDFKPSGMLPSVGHLKVSSGDAPFFNLRLLKMTAIFALIQHLIFVRKRCLKRIEGAPVVSSTFIGKECNQK